MNEEWEEIEDRVDKPPSKTKKQYARSRQASDRPANQDHILNPDESDLPKATVMSVRGNTLLLSGGLESTKPSFDIVVGDIAFYAPEKDQLIIKARQNRTTWIARIRGESTRRNIDSLTDHTLAANIDLGIIVVSAKQPDFHPHFVDRFLAILSQGYVPAAICINKSDLGSPYQEVADLYQGLDIPIFEVSTHTGSGIEKLQSYMRGKNAVFVGQSGVGKSSLVHAIAPDIDTVTQAVSERTGSGKHTTRASVMYEWSPNSFIIDTPGIRLLSIEQIPKAELRTLFHEFEEPAKLCQFRDCSHVKEERCGVKQAVTDGKLTKGRYDSYVRLWNE